jgi:hypothetical protein
VLPQFINSRSAEKYIFQISQQIERMLTCVKYTHFVVGTWNETNLTPSTLNILTQFSTPKLHYLHHLLCIQNRDWQGALDHLHK